MFTWKLENCGERKKKNCILIHYYVLRHCIDTFSQGNSERGLFWIYCIGRIKHIMCEYTHYCRVPIIADFRFYV